METLIALQKLKVDCLYTRQTQYRAAKRLVCTAEAFRYLLIVGTIFASFSSIMNIGIWDLLTTEVKAVTYLVNILGGIGGVFIIYSTAFVDYKGKQEEAGKHKQSADQLNLLFKKMRNTEAKHKDRIMNINDLASNLQYYTLEYSNLIKQAPQAKQKDFLSARKDFQKGYISEYTEEELNS